ncbi:uncharacterized protein EDB91DRAFT_1350986 [Suillus paluster]|uniref:uncharacterized protein n=1 Tax=Suillus paluster TaxID=48578 RepID=UPI001B87033F|nr:uncharacterized protein EDB91DRAFT_1350986 [Suillus paluster]KAG1724648.1 hypothetical protein EDB91DRAFT_1350986 [Suillus paluster]
MRFSFVVVALSAAFSTAYAAMIARQNSLPNCAVPCLANADYGNCSSTDDSCLCHSTAFINSTTTCIQASCTGSDLTNAEASSQELCAAVGVTLSTSATATSSSKATTTATSTPSSSSNAASSNTINVLTGAAAFALLAASL